MITNLRIKNVALIDMVEVTFGPGLNVLTGETGAGKSIVIDSINCLLGERIGREFIRNGADNAMVEGLIEVAGDNMRAGFSAMGFDVAEDGQLLISRVLYPQGRSVCRVNGKPVTVGMLKELSALLVDVHGQHEHQSLLDTRQQINLLDQFGGEALMTLKNTLGELLQRYRDAQKALKELAGVGGQREAQLEIWQFQVDEIKKAKLSVDEEDKLLLRRSRLNGLDKLAKHTREALQSLYSGESDDLSASDQISHALQSLQEIGRLDEEKAALADSLAEIAVQLGDIIEDLQAYEEELDADPAELERIEFRLDQIYRLKRKYGATVTDVLAHYEKTQAQLAKLLGSEAEIKRLTVLRRNISQEITALCEHISQKRKKAAESVQTQIAEVLRDLGMKHVQFAVQVEKKKEFDKNGNDRVEFLISPNLGEPLKSLSKIASGGEMSRVMLAIKTVMADADQIETLIFDEIDAGVSGRTAQQVAEKLARISRSRQILCITHLPQIAAMADRHFLIEKKTVDSSTVTIVKEQSPPEMIQELARLIGGAKITDATLSAADEMKQMANQIKNQRFRNS